MDGVNEDVPKCKMQSVDDVDEVLKKAKSDDKKAKRRQKIIWFVNRFYKEIFPYMHTNC